MIAFSKSQLHDHIILLKYKFCSLSQAHKGKVVPFRVPVGAWNKDMACGKQEAEVMEVKDSC